MVKRWAMVVDLQRCIGCHSCTVACKQENDAPLGAPWMKVFAIGPRGNFPDVQMCFFPRTCMHCDHPSCLDACPTSAISKREDGLVLVEEKRCSGCKDCMLACPYHALVF